MYENDKRVVATLDAGGTNFVFGAMRANEFIIDPITVPSCADDLDKCLNNMADGFQRIFDALPEPPVAISFAFPGPADYPRGIIGGFLPNFPSFRDGVALADFLSDRFGVPVFINNDGDLFAYGEAMAGALPDINRRLRQAGSDKQYANMLGYTFGTGFGIGMVIDGRLNRGNNSCVETFCLPHKTLEGIIAEDGVAIRAVKRVYGEASGIADHGLEPKDICEIADGTRPGNREAAIEAFRQLGEAAGHAIATAVTLTDSLVVIGGGLTGARRHFMPALLAEMRAQIATLGGDTLCRIPMEIFDLDDPAQFDAFARGSSRRIKVYGSAREVTYDPMKRAGVAISRLGASKAISIGAYAFALSELDARQ